MKRFGRVGRIFTTAFGFALAVMVVGACNARDETPTRADLRCKVQLERTSPTEAALCGTITPEIARAFVEKLPNEVNTLRLNSPGGETSAAMVIARKIQSRGLAVEIDGLCQSACAYLLLPAAKKVTVKRGSLVLLHHTTTLVAELAAKHPTTRSLANLKTASSEHALYKELGVATSWLYWPGLALDPQCIALGRDNGQITPTLFTKRSDYVPTLSEAREILPHLTSSDWPTSLAEAQERHIALLGRAGSLVYGLPTGLRTTPVETSVAGVGECAVSK